MRKFCAMLGLLNATAAADALTGMHAHDHSAAALLPLAAAPR